MSKMSKNKLIAGLLGASLLTGGVSNKNLEAFRPITQLFNIGFMILGISIATEKYKKDNQNEDNEPIEPIEPIKPIKQNDKNTDYLVAGIFELGGMLNFYHNWTDQNTKSSLEEQYDKQKKTKN